MALKWIEMDYKNSDYKFYYYNHINAHTKKIENMFKLWLTFQQINNFQGLFSTYIQMRLCIMSD